MKHAFRRPPQHAATPVLGDSLSAFLGAGEFFVAGYRRYGPAFRIKLMGEDYVVLTGEEMLEFFHRGGEKHLDREAFFGRYAAEMGDPNFILTKTGPEQLRLRRMLSLGFSRQVAGPFVSQLAANVRARAEADMGRPVSAMRFLTRVFLEHYGQLFVGRSLASHYRDALVFTVTAMLFAVSLDPPDHVLKTIPCPLPAPDRDFRLLVKEKRRPVVRPQTASREARIQAAAMMAAAGDPQVRDQIFGRAELAEYDGGVAIIRQGDPADAFFIIAKGHVEVSVSQEDGTCTVVRHLGPGDFFGEACILQRSPRTASVKALDSEAVEVLVIGREAFERMVSDSPAALDDIALGMAQRIASAFRQRQGDCHF